MSKLPGQECFHEQEHERPVEQGLVELATVAHRGSVLAQLGAVVQQDETPAGQPLFQGGRSSLARLLSAGSGSAANVLSSASGGPIRN